MGNYFNMEATVDTARLNTIKTSGQSLGSGIDAEDSKSIGPSRARSVFKSLTRTEDKLLNIDLGKLSLKVDIEEVNYYLVIDGDTLEKALKNNHIRQALAILIACARTVIACNMMPSQNMLLVKFIRKCLSYKPKVLATGGKASNGAMILEAHVGVGVSTDKEA
jgi:magnesium-transporting ATPase (P-type)